MYLKNIYKAYPLFPFQVSEVDTKFYEVYLWLIRKEVIACFFSPCPVNLVKAFLKVS